MTSIKPTTVDFETYPIRGRPDYPPVPIGVSIKPWKKKARYFGWGHVNGGNNCTRQDAINALRSVWNKPMIFHNAKFDLCVAEEHLGLPIPKWQNIHDTLFVMYLLEPRARTFALKPSAEKFLGIPPEERDLMIEWLVAHQPVPGRRLTPSKAGEFIALVPGEIVGPYADGDTYRTERIFEFGIDELTRRGMTGAYERERKLLPILLVNERQGINVDLDRLRSDVEMYHAARNKVDQWVLKKLGSGDINLNSADELGSALIRSGEADEAKIGLTASGKYSTNQESLKAAIKDPLLFSMLTYRAQLGTCLSTFMDPWLDVAERTGGTIHTQWNQVRSEYGGTTTGRFSSTPNFQNIPNEFDPLFWSKEHKALPKMPFKIPPLPFVRSYVVPGKGRVILDRDYSQQELRILGHFEDGVLKDEYNEDPWMDAHETTQQKLLEFGLHYERRPVKNTNFGIIYGQGAASLAVRNGLSIEDSRRLMKAIKNNIFPGLKDLFNDLRDRAKNDEPVRTWGGREYYCEEPKYNEKLGRWLTFDYKLLNLIVQGSAADCSKEALIRWWDIKHDDDRFLLSVHDQNTIDTPKKRREDAMKRLREAMESIEFDVPMLSDGKWTDTNWFDLKPYDKKGKQL